MDNNQSNKGIKNSFWNYHQYKNSLYGPVSGFFAVDSGKKHFV